MPQVSVKMFFLDDPVWPPPAAGVDDHWYYYGMGRVIPFLLGAWEVIKWYHGRCFSWATQLGLHLPVVTHLRLVRSCSWALVGLFCLAY